jgi:uroporphyrinogen-III decarboxylase
MPPERISVLNSVSFGWLHCQGGFTFGEPFFMNPRVRFEQERRMHAFVAERFPDEPIYNLEAHLVRVEGRRRPVALVGGLQPNLILAAALGAEFVFPPDKDPDVSHAPLVDCGNVDRLRSVNWAGTWPISLFLEQIGRMRESLRPGVAIIPPFFWDTTGRATTHGILTTAQKLFGERIFIDLMDNPTFVREVMAWVVDAYVALIHLFAGAAGMKITGLHTGDCSLCMIGPDPFVEFVLPELNRLGRAIGPIRLHSCGKSDHLLDALRLVENVAELNFGSDTSLAKIRERFGPIRVDLSPETKLLTSGAPADMDAWVRRCLGENDDGRLEFQCHLDAGQPEANCLQITRTLRDFGRDCPRVGVY